MNDNENENGKVGGWWAASTDADHEQVTLYRKEGNTECLLDRFTVTPDQYPTLEDFQLEVKKSFGGGVYVAAIRGERGQFAMRQTFAIAGTAKREASEEKQTAGGLSDLAAVLLKSQEASEARLLAVLEKLSEKPEAPDAFALMEKAAAILHRNGAAPTPAKSLVEQLQEMRTAAGLMGLTDRTDEGESGGNWAKDLIGAFGPVLMNGMSGQGQLDHEDQAEPTAASEQEQALNKLKILLASMVQLAEFEVIPAKAVAGIEKKAGPHWQMLKQIIQRDDAVTLAGQMVPAVEKHREWFEAFRAAVIGEPAGGKSGSTGKNTAGGKKTASSKPGATGQRSSRNTANA